MRIRVGDGSTWPRPSLARDPEYGVGHKLRYGSPSKSDLLEAASVIDAYGFLLLHTTARQRDRIVREIRAALEAEVADE